MLKVYHLFYLLRKVGDDKTESNHVQVEEPFYPPATSHRLTERALSQECPKIFSPGEPEVFH